MAARHGTQRQQNISDWNRPYGRAEGPGILQRHDETTRPFWFDRTESDDFICVEQRGLPP